MLVFGFVKFNNNYLFIFVEEEEEEDQVSAV